MLGPSRLVPSWMLLLRLRCYLGGSALEVRRVESLGMGVCKLCSTYCDTQDLALALFVFFRASPRLILLILVQILFDLYSYCLNPHIVFLIICSVGTIFLPSPYLLFPAPN